MKWYYSAHDSFGHHDLHCKSLAGMIYSINPNPIETTGYHKCTECWVE